MSAGYLVMRDMLLWLLNGMESGTFTIRTAIPTFVFHLWNMLGDGMYPSIVKRILLVGMCVCCLGVVIFMLITLVKCSGKDNFQVKDCFRQENFIEVNGLNVTLGT